MTEEKQASPLLPILPSSDRNKCSFQPTASVRCQVLTWPTMWFRWVYLQALAGFGHVWEILVCICNANCLCQEKKMYEFSSHSVLEKLISFGPQNAGAKLCTDVNIYIILVANWNLQRKAFFCGNRAQQGHVNFASFGGLGLQFRSTCILDFTLVLLIP